MHKKFTLWASLNHILLRSWVFENIYIALDTPSHKYCFSKINISFYTNKLYLLSLRLPAHIFYFILLWMVLTNHFPPTNKFFISIINCNFKIRSIIYWWRWNQLILSFSVFRIAIWFARTSLTRSAFAL